MLASIVVSLCWNSFEAHKMEAFARLRAASGMRVLDVGGRVIQGGARSIFESRGCQFISLDIQADKSVDVVSPPGQQFPFADGHFDLVITTSTFEHDPMFWLTIREMARVTRVGGWVHATTPSGGHYHPYPGDNYRLQDLAGAALGAWCATSFEGRAFPLAINSSSYGRGGSMDEVVLTWQRVSEPLEPAAKRVDPPSTAHINYACAKRLPSHAPGYSTTAVEAPQGTHDAEARRQLAEAKVISAFADAHVRSASSALVLVATGGGGGVCAMLEARGANVRVIRLEHRANGTRHDTPRRNHGAHNGWPLLSSLPTGSIDAIVSLSALSHDPSFWMTFRELARITRLGGYILTGEPHAAPPRPPYRLMLDAGAALAFWAGKKYDGFDAVPVALNATWLEVDGAATEQYLIWQRGTRAAATFTAKGLGVAHRVSLHGLPLGTFTCHDHGRDAFDQYSA